MGLKVREGGADKRQFTVLSRGGGGAEDSYRAWHFFCVRIIQQKVTSHLVELSSLSETKDGGSTVDIF